MKNKKIVYQILFTILGLLCAILLYGLSQMILPEEFLFILLVVFGIWGFRAGQHWWHVIYELKKYGEPWF